MILICFVLAFAGLAMVTVLHSKDLAYFTMLFTLRESLRNSGSTSSARVAFIAEGSK